MTIPTTGLQEGDLEPCPMCGGIAEMDTRQGYLAMGTGKPGSRCVIYCTSCGVDLGYCREDHPDCTLDDLIVMVTEAWNTRTLRSPSASGESFQCFECSTDLVGPYCPSCNPNGLSPPSASGVGGLVGALEKVAAESRDMNEVRKLLSAYQAKETQEPGE